MHVNGNGSCQNPLIAIIWGIFIFNNYFYDEKVNTVAMPVKLKKI
jgi:hypothetical protein